MELYTELRICFSNCFLCRIPAFFFLLTTGSPFTYPDIWGMYMIQKYRVCISVPAIYATGLLNTRVPGAHPQGKVSKTKMEKKKMYLQIYSFQHCLFLLKLVRILLVARVFVPICRKKIDQSAAGFSHYNRPGTWPHFLKPKSDFQVYL